MGRTPLGFRMVRLAFSGGGHGHHEGHWLQRGFDEAAGLRGARPGNEHKRESLFRRGHQFDLTGGSPPTKS